MAMSATLVSLLTLVALYAILTIGLNVKYGYTGVLDIGHAVFYLIGAYTTALLVAPPAASVEYADYILGLNMPWIPALVLGSLVAGVFGAIVSLPAIRLREDYIAIAMLGFSIIGIRMIQTEGWLANGPDSLSSFSVPLSGYFPLPGASVASALVLGAVIGSLWAMSTYAAGRQGPMGVGNRRAVRTVVRFGAYAVTTLGTGYLAGRLMRGRDVGVGLASAAVGLAVGTIAAGGAAGGRVVGAFVLFGLVGLVSLFWWVFAIDRVVGYFDDLSRVDVSVGVGLAVGFVVALAPGILVAGGGNGLPTVVGPAATVVLLAAYSYGAYRVVGSDTLTVGFGKVIVFAGVVLFVLRYFVLSSVALLADGALAGVLFNTVQNLLWLLNFTNQGVQFDYSRFLLIVTVVCLAFVYVVSELISNSPFGRVLNAIGEDELVAAALGKNPFSYKVQSMILGSTVAGLAGGLTAIYFQSLTYNMFHPRVTFFIFLIMIIGGAGSTKGMILGSFVYWGFQKATVDIASFFPSGELRAQIQGFRLAVFGLLFVLILYYRPNGLFEETVASPGARSE